MFASKVERFLAEVGHEVTRASTLHPPQNSLHEGYAVLLEEVDEFWDEVKKKSSKRDHEHIRTELIQIAAMACRTAIDCLKTETT